MKLRWAAVVLLPLTTYAAPAPQNTDTLVYSGQTDASPQIGTPAAKTEVLVAPNNLPAPAEEITAQPAQPETVMMKAARLEVLRVMEAKAAMQAAEDYEVFQRQHGELADNTVIAPPATALGSFSGSAVSPVTSAPPAAPIVTTAPLPAITPPAPVPVVTAPPAIAPPTATPPQSVSNDSSYSNTTSTNQQQQQTTYTSHAPADQDSKPTQKPNTLIDAGGGWGN